MSTNVVNVGTDPFQVLAAFDMANRGVRVKVSLCSIVVDPRKPSIPPIVFRTVGLDVVFEA